MRAGSESETGPESERLLDGELPVGGILVDRYQVLQRLSAGGMGVVYKAKHLALDDIVAIKLLLKPQDETDRKRFLLEARLATKIKHPNTVYVSDFGLLPDGRSFLVMEYMNGQTLSSVVKQGPMDPLRACRIAVQIARGLHAVHEQNIVHRDLKPDNIFLLTQDGQTDFVKIVDFGIAKAGHLPASVSLDPPGDFDPDAADVASAGTEGTAKLREALRQLVTDAGNITIKSAIIGTPPYMSPEAIRSKPVDGRADQYALGCVLFQLLTGQLPFQEDDLMALLTQHMYEPVPDVRALAPQVPASIAQLVTKLLAKQPEDRFPSMRELEQALDREIEIILVQRGERAVITSALAGLLKVQGKGIGAVMMVGGHAIPLWVMVPISLLLFVGGAGLGVKFLVPKVVKETLRPGELRALRNQALVVLRTDLKTAQAPLRASAALALGLSRDRELQRELVPLLTDENPQVRSQAAESLGLLGDRASVPILKGLLHAEQVPVARLGAALALDQFGDPLGKKELTALLSAGPPDIQLRAALARCESLSIQARTVLTGLLSRTDMPPSLRLSILGCLGRAGDAQSLSALRVQGQSAASAAERIAAQAKLAELGDSAARVALHELIRKRGPEHLLAARLLSGPDDTVGREVFRAIVTDPGAAGAARRLSAEGLGSIGELFDARALGAQLLGPQLASDLRQSFASAILLIASHDPALVGDDSLAWAETQLGDQSWLVRQAAVAVLGDTRSKDARRLLSRAIRDSDRRVRMAAARALGRHFDLDVLPILQVGLGDPDSHVRTEALRALTRIAKWLYRNQTPKVLPIFESLLAPFLARREGPEKTLALGTLVALGAKAHQQELLKQAQVADTATRKLVVEQLEHQAEPLAELVNDPDHEVRTLAAAQLGVLGDKRAVPVLEAAAGRGDALSLTAIGVLGSMQQRSINVDALVALFGRAPATERLAAVSSAGALPPKQALEILLRAARDPLTEIRHRAAEVAVELPDGQQVGAPVLHLLVMDKEAAVRLHALALLGSSAQVATDVSVQDEPAARTKHHSRASAPSDSRLDLGAESAPVTDLSVATPTPDHDMSVVPTPNGDSAIPADTPERFGHLFLEGPDFMEVQIDHHRWQPLPQKPIRLSVGHHRVVTLSEVKSIHIKEDQTLHLELKPSSIETTTRDGIDLYEKQQHDKALRLLERAYTRCERTGGKQYKGCGPLFAEIAYYKGSIFEAQDRIDSAATEYQRVVDSESLGGRAESFRDRANQSLQKLKERLGLILFKQQTDKGCQEEKLWVQPGNPVVKLGEESHSVRIHARQVVELGVCQ